MTEDRGSMGGNAYTKWSFGERRLKKWGSFWWHMAHLIVVSGVSPRRAIQTENIFSSGK